MYFFYCRINDDDEIGRESEIESDDANKKKANVNRTENVNDVDDTRAVLDDDCSGVVDDLDDVVVGVVENNSVV